jgi:hypothetical protein
LEDSDPSLAWAESETLSIKKPKGNEGWKCGSNSMALAQSPYFKLQYLKKKKKKIRKLQLECQV